MLFNKIHFEVASIAIKALGSPERRGPEGEAMATNITAFPEPVPASIEQMQNWYAVQTRARHEKIVAYRFLPLVNEVHRWSDRKKIVQSPLFSCYVFARICPTNVDRMRLLRVDGVLSLVGKRGEGTAVADEQIQFVKSLIDQRVSWFPHPFLQIGQRVRVRNGALHGMEGILLSRNGDKTLVVSIDAIQRSLAVRLEGYDLEAA
jgi:transcription antitermination factor NusG